MKNYIKTILLLSLSALVWTSCENDGFYYQDTPRVRLVGPTIWTLESDSLEFSFVSYGDQESINMDVEACVMGTVTDYDRTASIVVDAEKTTADATMYEVPNTVTIPAGSNKSTFAVTLKQNAILNNSTVRLYIKVADSPDFAIGNNEENHLLFKWNNMISKPTNWDELYEHFGEYSETKYRFMLSHAGGVTEFSTETMSWSELHNYNIIFTNALNEYNAAHTGNPLQENGVLITFPQ